VQILTEAKDHALPADIVHEELVMRLPSQDLEHLFETVLNWGRFAELFTYDADAQRMSLTESQPAAPAAAATAS
jgi:NitT/TauT family transport system ATP-binding protein